MNCFNEGLEVEILDVSTRLLGHGKLAKKTVLSEEAMIYFFDTGEEISVASEHMVRVSTGETFVILGQNGKKSLLKVR